MTDDEYLQPNPNELGEHRYCPRILWLMRRGVALQRHNQDVLVGRALSQSAYARKEKELELQDYGKVDFHQIRDGEVCETKKSPQPKGADLLQTKAYLVWLKDRNVSVERATVRYPKLRKTKVIAWSDAVREEVQTEIANATRTVAQEKAPPRPDSLRLCQKCAFLDYCHA